MSCPYMEDFILFYYYFLLLLFLIQFAGVLYWNVLIW